MAKKRIELFIVIDSEKDFNFILEKNNDKLICAEIYCSFVGHCTALDRLFNTIKLDWSDGEIVLLRVQADHINTLKRFYDQSQPFFMFIHKSKVTNVFRGVDLIRFAEMAKQEINRYKMEKDGVSLDIPSYDLDQITPDEMEYERARKLDIECEHMATTARRAARQAARKRHRAELMVPHLQQFNFVLFWPNAKHAHPELYERWDLNNIIMVGREEIQLTKGKAEDILYAGDAPLNEASLHALLSAPALVICFRLLDTDKHFVSLVRKILYEEISPFDENKPMNEQFPKKTAFDMYKSYSLSKEEIFQKRREEKMRKQEDIKEKRARRLSEMQRLARQAQEDAIASKRAQKEQYKLELLKSGNLDAYNKLRVESDDEEVIMEVPEELPEEIEEERSEEEDPDEYFPPSGLLIPGFYAPPNDIAKANGLSVLFPKMVHEHVVPQNEFLPPHVLVMLHISKRYRAVDVMKQHKSSILHMGIFKVISPRDAVLIAYSVKQYESLHINTADENEMKLCFMLSIENDLPLLALMDLNPLHVSRDSVYGEEECAALFPVDYGDVYPEFEDFKRQSALQ